MKKLLLTVCFALALFNGSCQPPATKTVTLLNEVHKDLVVVKQNLVEAKTAIDNATQGVDRMGGTVGEATVSATVDAKQLKEAQDDYNKLRSNPWVKFILFVRNFIYFIIGAYLVVGIVFGILFGRGFGFASHVLDALPLANIFKGIGKLFAKK